MGPYCILAGTMDTYHDDDLEEVEDDNIDSVRVFADYRNDEGGKYCVKSIYLF